MTVGTACVYDIGDRVKVLVGEHMGDTGRVVARKAVEVEIQDFYRRAYVYEVDFEFGNHGRGYKIQFQPQHLERTR